MESLIDLLIGAIIDTDLAIEGFLTGACNKFEGTCCFLILHNLSCLFVLDGTATKSLIR